MAVLYRKLIQPAGIHFLLGAVLAGCGGQPEGQDPDKASTAKQASVSVLKPYLARQTAAKQAFADFLSARQLSEHPPHYLDTSDSPSAVQLQLDSRGMPRGIWAFSPDGLGRATAGHSQYVLDFVRTAPGLWGITDGESAKLEFRLVRDELTKSPRGRTVRHLTFEQSVGPDKILDAGLQAVFWNDVLASVTGPIVLPSELPSATAMLSPSTLKTAAEAQLASVGLAGYSIQEIESGIHSQLGYVAQYRARTTGGGDDHLLTVRRSDGRILDAQELSQRYPSTEVTYDVYRPSSTATTTREANVVSVSGWGADYYSTYYFPWTDELTNRSPVPTYNEAIYWGSVMGFPLSYDDTFDYNAGSTAFHTQHDSYWAQKAVHTADINFTWWPPSNSNYKYRPVTVLSNCSGDTRFGNGGCWSYELWRDADEDYGCICLNSDNQNYGDNAEAIDTIFHEVGHAIDSKYLSGSVRTSSFGTCCDPGTSEEAKSLSEGIAMIYSQMMILQEFGTSTNFSDYDAVSSSLAHLGANFPSAIVHEDDSSVICHAPHNTCGGALPYKTWQPTSSPSDLPAACDSTSNAGEKYRYALPLVQAYWEVAHGLNCDGPAPCWVMNDGADTDEARWALFYAMKSTAASGTYWDFVANFLSYFYYDVGSTEWNNRWWVFNHHRLVGPDYGYSPCHQP